MPLSTLLLAIIAPCVAIIAFLLTYCFYRGKRMISITNGGALATSGDTRGSSSINDQDDVNHTSRKRRLQFPFLSHRSADDGASTAAMHVASMRISSSSSSLSPVTSLWQQPQWSSHQPASKSTRSFDGTDNMKSPETRDASYTNMPSPIDSSVAAAAATTASPAHSFQSALRVTSEIGDDDDHLCFTANPALLDDDSYASPAKYRRQDPSHVFLTSDWSSGFSSSGEQVTRVADIEAASASRLVSRRRLRYALERLLSCSNAGRATPSVVTVNRNQYVVLGGGSRLKETPLAFFVRCVALGSVNRSPLVLKFFVQQDEPLARNEWNALRRVYQRQHQRDRLQTGEDDDAWPIVPELVDAQLHHSLADPDSPTARPLVCSVLALRPGTSTTFLHVARSQADCSRRVSVLQQLERVVRALRALHSCGIVHCGLHMTGLVVFPGNQLRFWVLEHATRCGETVVPSFAADVSGFGGSAVVVDPAALEFMAPELARAYVRAQQQRSTAYHKRVNGYTFGRSSSSNGTNIWSRISGNSSSSSSLNRLGGSSFIETSASDALVASPALDVWALGVLILKMYCAEKRLDELRAWQLHHHDSDAFVNVHGDNSDANGVLQRLADPRAFGGFARSLEFYVEHDDIRDLARRCLTLNPAARPTMEEVMAHPCWQRFRQEQEASNSSNSIDVAKGTTVDSARTSVTVYRSTVVPRQRQQSDLLLDIAESYDEEQATAAPEHNDESITFDPATERTDGRLIKEIEMLLPPAAPLEPPLPPSLWLLLPPSGTKALASVENWIVHLQELQSECRCDRSSSSSLSSRSSRSFAGWEAEREQGGDSDELLFTLVPMCEHYATDDGSEHARRHSSCCDLRAFTDSGVIHVPESLLALVVPVVQETLLFLRARAVLIRDGDNSGDPEHTARVNGLDVTQWKELLLMYEALECLQLVGASLISSPMLAPLERMLESGDRAKARQVLDELKCLVFSAEKREFVRGLLEVLAVTDPAAAAALSSGSLSSSPMAVASLSLSDPSELATRSAALEVCDVTGADASAYVTTTRWLCPRHHCQHRAAEEDEWHWQGRTPAAA